MDGTPWEATYAVCGGELLEGVFSAPEAEGRRCASLDWTTALSRAEVGRPCEADGASECWRKDEAESEKPDASSLSSYAIPATVSVVRSALLATASSYAPHWHLGWN